MLVEKSAVVTQIEVSQYLGYLIISKIRSELRDVMDIGKLNKIISVKTDNLEIH